MKLVYKLFVAILLLFSISFAQDLPFHKGVNITNWFQADSPQQIQFSKYTRTDFEQIKSLGADAIRLPINLHYMTDGAPKYNLDPLFLSFLDKVVDWAEELNFHLILDNHTFDVNSSTETDIDKVLIPVWQNMARHFKDRSTLLYYEVLNEPHGISDSRWNEIQIEVVKKIREIDTVHTIVVGPADWNSVHHLAAMPEYLDDKLIYTFHFYDPFIFTHQGASWTNPSMAPLANVPFPYNATKMPEVPSELIGTWIASNMKNTYPNEGNAAKVKEFLNIAKKFKEERNAVLWCGEFGVYNVNSNNDDRAYWYQVVREHLEEIDIAWTIWDYKGGFGLFEKGTDEMFESDLNVPILEALGFEIPEQSDPKIIKDVDAIPIYLDYIENGLQSSSNTGSATLNFYNTENPNTGEYCIYWTGASRYNSIALDFKPNRDFSYLVENNFALEFWIKMEGDFKKFDVRFLDTKTDVPEDHPWRIKYTITENDINADRTWKKFSVKLNQFIDGGSWDNEQWFNAVSGAFDWTAVDRLEFVAEHEAIGGTKIWFDDINIQDPLVSVQDNEQIINTFELSQNYPNPFNPTTTIKYTIPIVETGHAPSLHTTLKVFDLLGRQVAVLVNEYQKHGNYEIDFNANNLSSGIYLYRLDVKSNQINNDICITKKMLFLK